MAAWGNVIVAQDGVIKSLEISRDFLAQEVAGSIFAQGVRVRKFPCAGIGPLFAYN